MIICRPGGARGQGLLERAHGRLERSFLPGGTFSRLTCGVQHPTWVVADHGQYPPEAGARVRPADRITDDKTAMLALPSVAPATGWRVATRLARDHYIRLDSNDYSVHPSVIGRRVEVVADLHRVRVLSDGSVVADHERVRAWHPMISDPNHVQAAKVLRRKWIGALRSVSELDVEMGCLADYETALGLGTDGGVA